MIHVSIHRDSVNEIGEIKISITSESIPAFKLLVDRALGTWDSAPAELKELGDMLTHGYVTQDHTLQPINTKQNTDYRSLEEQEIIQLYITKNGQEAFLEAIRENKIHKILSGELT